MDMLYSPKPNKSIILSIFFFLFFIPLVSAFYPQGDTSLTRQLTREDLVRGERLFHGLVHPGTKNMKCSECHSTFTAIHYDTVNWNPDALDISLKYLDRDVKALSRVLLNPTGEKMSKVHADFKLTDEEVMLLKGFMDSFPAKGLKNQKPVITNLILFIIAALFFLVALTDLVVTKKLKKQWINLAILSVTTVYITWVLVQNAIDIGHSEGYSPDQPIKFSHAIHAGQNKTDCLYCHNYAHQSKVSGIPSGNVCMNCHLIVRNGTRSGMFEIAKVVEGYEKGQPIKWIKVHNLPDHVYYNHSQHVNVAGLQCQECHGPVEEMDRITQIRNLSMGWCIDCHRTRDVNFNENEFYSQYQMLAERVKKGEISSVSVDMQGGNDCMKCHY